MLTMKKPTLYSLMLALSLTTGCNSLPLVSMNKHKVSSGVYRTGQLTPEELEQLIIDKKLTHYINLKGKFYPGYFDGDLKNWNLWDDSPIINAVKHKFKSLDPRADISNIIEESAVCKKYGVEYFLFDFSARNVPSKKELLEFIDLLTKLKSIGARFSFHCQGGSDRSAFVDAMWSILNGYSAKQAVEKAYKLRYGHLSYGDYRKPMKFLKRYRYFEHEMNLREYVEKHYDNVVRSLIEG